MIRHRDVERGAVHVLQALRTTNSAVVLGTAISGANDEWLAQPVAQRLQLVERRFVDEQLAGPAAGDLGRKFGQRQTRSGTSRQ